MGSVFLSDINDYIAPSQACINPLFTAGPSKSDNVAPFHSDPNKSSGPIRRRPRQSVLHDTEGPVSVSSKPVIYNSSKDSSNTQKSTLAVQATISVADCLACSGCVTTAETVLVSQHSLDTLRREILEYPSTTDNRQIIFTISRASFVDLARVLIPPNSQSRPFHNLFLKLASFLHIHYKAHLFMDGDIPLQLSLMESAKEFCRRYQFVMQEIRNGDTTGSDDAAASKLDERITLTTPSISLSATETRFILPESITSHQRFITLKHRPGYDPRFTFLREDAATLSSNTLEPYALPMLSSSCPAFVCFIEKTVHDLVPNLSTVKSPMAMAGALLKHSSNNNSSKKEVYHVAIMPCHDKKLEASRKDFAFDCHMDDNKDPNSKSIRSDIDLVITTSEFFEALLDASNQKTLDPYEQDPPKKIVAHLEHLETAPCIHLSTKFPFDLETMNTRVGAALVSSSMDKEMPTTSGSTISWTGSGGYAEYLFRYASQTLFQYEIPLSQPLPWKRASFLHSTRRVRKIVGEEENDVRKIHRQVVEDVSGWDVCEVSLYRHGDGMYSLDPPTQDENNRLAASPPVLKFALAYGFKNIQMLLQKISKNETRGKASPYHYIELMACPSGCLNGGGQVQPIEGCEYEDGMKDVASLTTRHPKKETPTEARSRVQKNQEIMNRIWSNDRLNEDMDSLSNHDKGMEEMLHTRHHVVPKLELTTGATAGVSVEDTRW